jgi:hypothetical protein
MRNTDVVLEIAQASDVEVLDAARTAWTMSLIESHEGRASDVAESVAGGLT